MRTVGDNMFYRVFDAGVAETALEEKMQKQGACTLLEILLEIVLGKTNSRTA